MKSPISILLVLGIISTCSVGNSKQVSQVAPPTPSVDGHNAPPFIEDKVILTPEEKQALGQAEPGPDYRLPTSLIPNSYFLKIRPIIDKDYPGIGKKNTAPGNVVIQMHCNETTNRIVLHSKFLEINESSITVSMFPPSPPEVINVTSVEYDEVRDFLIINLQTEVLNGTMVDVSIDFIANVPPNDSLRGLYSEEYWDPIDNRTKVMAVTQMEPLRARQVFPCMDEPTYKSTFFVGIGSTWDFYTLANSPYQSSQQDPANPEWTFHYYLPTVPMPTYLLALSVSEYESNDAPSSLYRLPVKVWGPRHLIREGRAQLTANATAMLMANFERKFEVPHNNAKVDSISVPYKRGAMENYGLITYGEYYLMHYEGTTTSSELRNIYNILAHELAHQWFGNLLTCEWWSDIWLNEGFASYMSYSGQHDLWPEFDMNIFMLSSVNGALQYDAGPYSHPIHQEAYDAQQIGSNMDTIAYDKGASLVRMMVSFLGEHVFYDGIIEYLLKHYDGVVHQNDLFFKLNDSARSWAVELPKNMTEIMNSWTLQKGFPLVRVSQSGLDELTISQETWQNADVRNDTSDPGTAWDIPVKYLVESVQSGSMWLLKEQRSTNLTMQNMNGWILINPDGGGYYRTLYDEQLATLITAQLERNHSVFPAEGRVRLLDDQLNLGLQQYIPIKSALEFTKYLKNERDSTVWHAVLGNLAKLKNFYRNLGIGRSEDLEALDASLGGSISAALAELDEDVHATPSSLSILRSQLMDWSCTLDLSSNSSCNHYAIDKYNEWKETGINPIHTDIQSTLYCKMGENNLGYSWLMEQYRNTNDSAQKSRLSAALGCSSNFTTTLELVDLILTGSIEKQHSIPIFQKLFTHSFEGFITVYYAFIESPNAIPDYYDGDLSSVIQILSAAGAHFTRESDLSAIESIQEMNPDFYKGALDPVMSTIQGNIQWLGTFREDMTSWFKENPSPSFKGKI